jgi:V/A-type H+-transporting ATPase subunit E
MSLETVVEDIREQARARADEIRGEGEQRAEEIVQAARQDAEELRTRAEREVESEIEQERKQKLSSGKLEAKQKRLEARRDALEDVHDRVKTRVANINGDTREELTRALLSAAAREFRDESETVRVYGRPEDESLLRDVLEDEDYDRFEYAGERDCLGGVVVEGGRSRVRVNNTFESVLEGVWESELREVSNRLFENGENE